ncbi:MAG: prolyl-tRNA synthetase [Pseudomonadota bacterium]|nr:prolyl-tRNA synthetase [Pseudomonadota bacterium]
MRASQWFISTLKENPNDAELASHRLMLRAGLIRKLGSGLYTWMPMGLKILRKIENIVREEMNRAGALEILMPAAQPAELWEETGRWETFGNQLLKMYDSQNRAYCYGPTHEEVVTDLMRKELKSYKQLPLNLYQIQTKFRDEIRPRFGVMRAREFLMKDAYSFHLTPTSLEETYQKMYAAYHRIFTRMGLNFRAVEADTGAIGGAVSHEFQVLADAGEDIIFYSDSGTYAANVEMAKAQAPEKESTSAPKAIEKVYTPGDKTISDVAKTLQLPENKVLKTLIVAGNGEHPLVALVLKGDDELNEVKAIKHPWIHSPLRMVSEEELKEHCKLPVGYLGPIDLPIPAIIDTFAYQLSWFACGANEADYHFNYATWESIQNPEIFDLRSVQIGDISPDGQGKLTACHGIEVGHVFQLGIKYSEAMKFTVLDEQGKPQVPYMGCYGIGVSRLVAAAIEQHHDERGIIWPQTIAPFDVVIIPMLGKNSEAIAELTDKIDEQLRAHGFDALIDDRKERAGVLFADQDLIGIPHRIVIGEKALAEGTLEYKNRATGEVQYCSLSEIIEILNTASK